MSDALDLARHRRALELCGEAAELTPAERADFVGQFTGDDLALAALVAELLARIVPDDSLGVEVRERPLEGSELAGYRVVRLLGEGGMGAVYLAEREVAGVTREVALKTLQRIRPGAEDTLRFRAEQQTLAQLHHPYVATLIDVGTSADGAPFFAMEYVPGLDIVRWCDARRATLAERITLWEKVCDAVAYAHRNLVVHRDIKPANILVTDDGLPKLLDFGIAKLLEGSDQQLTAAFARHLTLDYATPERIQRNAVSTADDIYALGVLLYELVVGKRPFARGGLSLERLLEGVTQERAPNLAEHFARADNDGRARIAAARRRSERQLRSELRGDLDAVLRKALHVDAARRYSTVEQFVDDVRRCARGLPVTARGDGVAYRLLRFVGRHRVGLAAATVSVLALIGALVVSVAQTRYAADQARRSTAVSGFLQEVLAAPSARWDTRWRGTPDVSMVDVLHLASRNLEIELSDQPDVKIELHTSLARAYASLGRNADAVAQQRRAVAIAHHELPEDSPVRPQTRHDLAMMLDYLRTPAALAEARVQIAHGLAWHDRYAPGPTPSRASLLGETAVNLSAQRRYAEAAKQYQLAIDTFHASGAPPTHPLLGVGYGLMGLALVDSHQLARARPALERGIDIQLRHSGGPTSDALYPLGGMAFIAIVSGEEAEARRLAAIALDYSRRIRGWRNPTTAMVLLGNALVLREFGHVADARRLVTEAAAIIGEQPEVIPNDGFEALTLAQAEHALLEDDVVAAMTQLDKLAHLRTSRLLRGISYDHPGRYLVALARAQARLGRPVEARATYASALAWREPIFGTRSSLVTRIRAEQAALPVIALTGRSNADTSR